MVYIYFYFDVRNIAFIHQKLVNLRSGGRSLARGLPFLKVKKSNNYQCERSSVCQKTLTSKSWRKNPQYIATILRGLIRRFPKQFRQGEPLFAPDKSRVEDRICTPGKSRVEDFWVNSSYHYSYYISICTVMKSRKVCRLTRCLRNEIPSFGS